MVSLICPSVTSDISLQLVELRFWVLKILPRTLGTDLKAVVRICSPTVESLVKEIVRVRVMELLNTIVSTAVEPTIALESSTDSARYRKLRSI